MLQEVISVEDGKLSARKLKPTEKKCHLSSLHQNHLTNGGPLKILNMIKFPNSSSKRPQPQNPPSPTPKYNKIIFPKPQQNLIIQNIIYLSLYNNNKPTEKMQGEPNPRKAPPKPNSSNKDQQSNTSSWPEGEKSQDELYFSKYFLNGSFKILHLDIVGTQEVCVSVARQESYMIYVIRVLTEEFSYQVRRRYSEFLGLYQNISNLQTLRSRSPRSPRSPRPLPQPPSNPYIFPTKKLSSSLLHFFNRSTKQKLAEQRKSQLSTFLNQIKNNYYKLCDQFVEDYIELLRFIDVKEEHQKFWRKKEGRCLELANLTLKDTNLPNINKGNQKPVQANIEHLSELLQHQINKINFAIITHLASSQSQQPLIPNDPLVTNEIIKNVESIKDIVLEMKRKINYQHIRCILKGKTLNQDPNSQARSKKGLIEYCLRHTENDLVTLHFLKTILNIFLNSECNYSCDGFVKVLAEMEPGAFGLSGDREVAMLGGRDIRELYFKLVKQFFMAREAHGADKRHSSERGLVEKIMGTGLADLFHAWNEASQKNKQFKLKDDQKQWTMIIENLPQKYSPRAHNPPNPKHPVSHRFQKTLQTPCVSLSLHTESTPEHCSYTLQADLANKSYKSCLEIMKDEQKWNPLLVRSQIDVYSHTRKDVVKLPGKLEKIFRFREREEISMVLEADGQGEGHGQYPAEEADFIEHFVAIGEQEACDNAHDEKNPKMSTQTTTTANGSCAYKHEPVTLKQNLEQITDSLASDQLILMKYPPQQSSINSYSQRVKVQKLHSQGQNSEMCRIVIELQFTQPSTMKYFLSEIQGSSLYIWNGFVKAFAPELLDSLLHDT